jgi:hypothetical protein
VKPLVVGNFGRIARRWRRVPESLHRNDLSRIATRGFDCNPSREYPPEVSDPEKQYEQHRQDEGELDQGLAAT